MKTQWPVYRRNFSLCVTIIFLLALTAPTVAGQDTPPKPAGGASATSDPQDKNESRARTTGQNENATRNTPSPKPSASPKATTQPAGNRGPQPASTPRPVNVDSSNPSIENLQSQIDDIKKSQADSQDSLGWLAWLTTPVIALIALLLLIALSLHLLHFLRLSSLSHFVERLAKSHAALGQAAKGNGSQVNNTALEKLAGELDRQGQVLNQFSSRLNQVDGRLKATDNQFEDAAHAITLAANWIGQSQLKTAFAADGGRISDSERAAAISMLERYREPLRQNANRVEAVSQALAELVQSIGGRAYVSPELSGRLQTLFQGINRFDGWHAEVADELNSLQLGSVGQRNYMFQAGQNRLVEQVNQGSLSVAQMVQKSRELMESYFPEPAYRPVKETIALTEREASLKKILNEASDYLMDWYNSLFQFQHQLEQGQRSAAEAELAEALSKVQQLAREALNKFDVQPEAISIGQTQYDRRLHEAILVRQSQFPLNTVIEIHECGFRRMSTGEALRRPQVIVAGARTN